MSGFGLRACLRIALSPSKVVWRARIVLASADGEPIKAICRATGKSKPCVWRWQKRFAEQGVDGLLRP